MLARVDRDLYAQRGLAQFTSIELDDEARDACARRETDAHVSELWLERLPAAERRALLRAEIERGFSGDVSDKSLDAIIADARARRAGNG